MTMITLPGVGSVDHQLESFFFFFFFFEGLSVFTVSVYLCVWL